MPGRRAFAGPDHQRRNDASQIGYARKVGFALPGPEAYGSAYVDLADEEGQPDKEGDEDEDTESQDDTLASVHLDNLAGWIAHPFSIGTILLDFCLRSGPLGVRIMGETPLRVQGPNARSRSAVASLRTRSRSRSLPPRTLLSPDVEIDITTRLGREALRQALALSLPLLLWCIVVAEPEGLVLPGRKVGTEVPGDAEPVERDPPVT